MKIDERTEGDAVTLFLNGNFDEATSPGIEEKLNNILDRDAREVILDLSEVEYISSAGIRVLIVAHKKAVKNGKRVRLGDMSEKVRDIIDMVGIMPLFSDARKERGDA